MNKLIVGFVTLIGIFGLVGWANNIWILSQMDGISGMLLLRVAGIFLAPLGAILGYV